MSLEGDETARAHFKAVCVRFYRDGDAEARAVVELFERSAPPTEADASQTVAVTVDAPPALSPAAQALVDACGVASTVSMSQGQYLALVTAKNEARAEVHAELQARRKQQLQTMIASRGAITPSFGVAGGAAPLSSRESADGMRAAVRRFVHTHAAKVGAQAFLKGLVRLLEQQHQSPTVWRWVVLDETFTETGDDTFTRDAVELLMGYFKHAAAGAPHVPLGSHGWDVEPTMSDRHIRRLLDATRVARRSDMSPSGDLVDTGLPRTNQDGTLDEPDDCLSLYCLIL